MKPKPLHLPTGRADVLLLSNRRLSRLCEPPWSINIVILRLYRFLAFTQLYGSQRVSSNRRVMALLNLSEVDRKRVLDPFRKEHNRPALSCHRQINRQRLVYGLSGVLGFILCSLPYRKRRGPSISWCDTFTYQAVKLTPARVNHGAHLPPCISEIVSLTPLSLNIS